MLLWFFLKEFKHLSQEFVQNDKRSKVVICDRKRLNNVWVEKMNELLRRGFKSFIFFLEAFLEKLNLSSGQIFDSDTCLPVLREHIVSKAS